ncbi:extracellular solute-binding protein [Paenibacillus sp. MMS20-IR301]|uniref:ABC transporter substrate-binding protein n=1 Tax=Paenibacillus sp. MMS20-IR301 TaxID=2895946 RepID=UPI0028E4658F|nr:extracellular solute-binding protein [Paenibacillus sp. MMS20-IR301]WNS44896.1 extracellular solute-binding protein [Paenibacillus sp. MMS20-IR301]
MPIRKSNWTGFPPLLLAAGLLLSGCGGGGDSAGTVTSGQSSQHTGSTAGGPAPVSFTIGYASGDPATKQAIGETIKAFMESYPQVRIQDISENGSSAYLDWLKVKDAVGEFPDLVEMRDTEAFAGAEKIVPLPDELAELFDDPPQVDGKVWNAPLFVSAPQGIIYSKKAYAAAGITALPATYDEFLEVQGKLKASGITPLAVGGKDIFHIGFWVNKFLIDDVYAQDPDWNAKRNAGSVSFTDDNVVRAMSDFKELLQNYTDPGWVSTGDNLTASLLVSGRAAQLFSGSWMFSQIREADPGFEFGFYAVPDRKGKLSVVGLQAPSGWSISAQAAADPLKKQAIGEFIRFFFSPEPYSKFLSRIDSIPSTKVKVARETSEQMQTVLELMADPQVTKSLMMNIWWGDNLIPPQFRNWFYKLLQDMVVQDGDVLEYMKRADTEYDRQAEEYRH